MLPQAKSACHAQLAKQPECAELNHLAAMIATSEADYTAALQHINLVLAESPDDPKALNSRGNIWLRMGNIEKASADYRKAIDIDGQYAPAHNNLGNCLLQLDNPNAAETSYLKAIKAAPNFADAHYNYGRLLLAKGNLKSAHHILEHAHSINPDHAPILGQLGEIYLLEEKYTEAILFFKSRLEQQPHHAETQHRIGLAYLKQKRLPEAIKHLTKAVNQGGSDNDSCYHLATAHIEANQPREALKYYLMQLEKSDILETTYNIAVILMAEERHEEALGYFKVTLEKDPQHLDAVLNMGAIYLKIGRLQSAIEQYESALRIDPGNAEFQHILNALSDRDTSPRAPDAYVKSLFDHYAHFYDQHLKDSLHYHVPQQMFVTAGQLIQKDTNRNLRILDLGCGTGLCGEFFADWAKHLVGIDLSSKMIKVADQKNLYHELVIGDIESKITPYKEIDLVIAADVLTYIGKLDTLFQAIANTLSKDGIFLFTVEKSHIAPYQLQKNIRYAHHMDYLEEMTINAGMQFLCNENITLRKQHGKPVAGYLIATTVLDQR